MSDSSIINSQSERTLALGALIQCAFIVHSTANPDSETQASGSVSVGSFTIDGAFLLAPVLRRAGDATADLLPAGAQRQRLLRSARSVLTGQGDTPRVLAYVIELVELARRLRNHQAIVEKLGSLLDQVPATATPDADALANVYQQTISTLGRRIQVTGDPGLLQQPQVASRIRAMLLGGVRYAWLWHQLGGRRWHLILNRGAILRSMQLLETTT